MTIRIAVLWGLCSVAAMAVMTACSPANNTHTSNSEFPADTPSVSELTTQRDNTSADSDCQLTMGFDIWEPYQFIDIGDEIHGLDVEIARAATTHMGCELAFVQATWVELLFDLQHGDVDFVMGASVTSEREEFAYFSDAYREEQFVFFARQEDQRQFRDMTLSDVLESGMRIGIVDGYYYGDDFQTLYQQSDASEQFVGALMSEFNLTRLLDHDIDGFLEDQVVGHSLLRRKGLGDYIELTDIELPATSVYIMFSQESVDSDMVRAFDQALDELKNNGEYDAIMQRYVP